jgi:dihydroflavonol-4-reductase
LLVDSGKISYMATVFITGATGFIGGHMVRRLCSQGHTVKALVRPITCHDTLRALPLEIVLGDLSQVPTIRKAMEGCDVVYHAAADYRLWTRNPAEMYAANVDGTKNMMQAAWDLKIPKIVYTSTVGTIGLQGHRQSADESSFLQIDSKTGHYKKSKFQAEQVVLEFARKGLPVVIVNPSAPVGSHDWKPTPTGRMIVDFLNGRMPMYLDTGLNIVDAEDIAEGHFLAAQKGRVGERYILGNENLSLRDILILLSDITSIPAPKIRCPYPVAFLAAIGSETFTWIFGGKEPRVPLEGVNMARKFMFFSSKKAKEELGFSPGTARLALEKAVRWFVENGYVSKPLPQEYRSSLLTSSEGSKRAFRVDEEAVAVAK